MQITRRSLRPTKRFTVFSTGAQLLVTRTILYKTFLIPRLIGLLLTRLRNCLFYWGLTGHRRRDYVSRWKQASLNPRLHKLLSLPIEISTSYAFRIPTADKSACAGTYLKCTFFLDLKISALYCFVNFTASPSHFEGPWILPLFSYTKLNDI